MTKLPILDASAVGQVAFVVEDLRRAVSEQWAMFGVGPFAIGETSPRVVSFFHEEPVRRFSARVAINAQQPRIELLQPIDPPGMLHAHVAQRGYGLHHLGFYVASLESSIERMRDAGYDVVAGGVGFGADGDGGFAFFATFDALGYDVEIIEPPARRNPPAEVYPEGAAFPPADAAPTPPPTAGRSA